MATGDKLVSSKIEDDNTAYRSLACSECSKIFTANFGKGGVQNVIIVEHTSNGHSFRTVRTK